MKNIIHQNTDGSISVTIMAPVYVADRLGAGLTEQQILDAEASKVIPASATRLPDHDTSELPDFSFHDAWVFDPATQKVVMDATKKTAIQWDRVRSQRNQLLDESDPVIKSQQAKANTGKANKLTDWNAYQQALRDVPDTQTDPFNIAWPAKPQ